MCYTARLNYQGLKFFISNCFGIGFDWEDPEFIEAVKNHDPRIEGVLNWAANGKASEYDRAATFESDYLDHNSKRYTLDMLRHAERDEIESIYINPFLSEKGKDTITQYLNGELKKLVDKEEETQPIKGNKNQRGFIYLIHCDNGLYKIGKSKKVSKRLETFNTLFPATLNLIHSFETQSYSNAEALLHERFDEKHVHGEWYELDEQDIAEIIAIKDFEL